MFKLRVVAMLAVALMVYIASSSVAYAAEGRYCPRQSFITLPTWHKYLPIDTAKSGESGRCEVKFRLIDPTTNTFNGGGIMLIGLAIIDIITRIAGLAAFGFIVYGGFRYMTSQGSPDGTKAASATILNATVGLVIALLAAAIVSFIGFSLT